MLKWSLLALGLGWAASMIYEWMWCGGSLGLYIIYAVMGLLLILGLFVSSAGAEYKAGKPQNFPPMIWFLLAAVTCALFYSALERAPRNDPVHVQLLPLYFILFLDFFGTGCYTWWKKLKSRAGK